MLVNRTSFSRPLVVVCAATFVALLGVGVGCGTTADDIPQGTTTNLYGLYQDPIGPGTIELTGITYPTATATLGVGPGPNAIPLSGELRIAGQPTLTLTGYYDPDTTVITFGSDSPFYTFYGNVAAGTATGVGSGPNGSGPFMLFLGGTAATSSTYCGTVLCDTPVGCTATGSFNVVVSGSVALMTANYDGTPGVGVGTATASTVDFHIVNTQYGVDITIHGDISGTNITGDWTDNSGNGYAGTWSGSSAQCSAALVK